MKHDNTTRLCLLGLPRTGSQYIAKMISYNTEALNIIEPFTISDSLPSIDINDNLIFKSPHINFESLEKQIEYVLKCLNDASLDQSLVMRLFLVDHIIPYVPTVIKKLADLKFKFLIIRRENIEHHLLSYLIATHTNIWNTKHSDDKPYSNDKLFAISNLKPAVDLYTQLLVFDKIIGEMNLDCATIRYEHAVNDIEEYLGKRINPSVDIKKQISGDPYNLISNDTEVKQFLEKLLNK